MPLFVSRRRLQGRVRLPVAAESWALDSGGFTELNNPPHRWQMTVDEYVELVERFGTEIGRLDWAAPMDSMCEPHILEACGTTVEEHQHATVANYLELRGRGPFIPVLQGWTVRDYERCIDLYCDAGVDLAAEQVVGLGSVCRRQGTTEIGEVVRLAADVGISPHGFGVKRAGLLAYGGLLTSADSMAWSYRARRSDPLPGCSHRNCAGCLRYALRWRERILDPGVQMVLA